MALVYSFWKNRQRNNIITETVEYTSNNDQEEIELKPIIKSKSRMNKVLLVTATFLMITTVEACNGTEKVTFVINYGSPCSFMENLDQNLHLYCSKMFEEHFLHPLELHCVDKKLNHHVQTLSIITHTFMENFYQNKHAEKINSNNFSQAIIRTRKQIDKTCLYIDSFLHETIQQWYKGRIGKQLFDMMSHYKQTSTCHDSSLIPISCSLDQNTRKITMEFGKERESTITNVIIYVIIFILTLTIFSITIWVCFHAYWKPAQVSTPLPLI